MSEWSCLRSENYQNDSNLEKVIYKCIAFFSIYIKIALIFRCLFLYRAMYGVQTINIF